MLGALICQLCMQSPELPSRMQDFVRKFSTDTGQFISPDFDDLEAVFRDLLGSIPSVTIVLDALDECTNRDHILSLLQRLPTSMSCRMRVLVTSRREGDIEEAFTNYAQYSLRVHADDKDIDAYISSAINTNKRLQRLPPELKNRVRTTLYDETHGM